MEKSHLVEGCQQLLDITNEWILAATTVAWRPTYGDHSRGEFFKLSVLAIVTKQSESLQVILSLAATTKGFSAVPLLRAMFEELIWIRFLATLSPSAQGTIIADLASTGLSEALDAQDAYGVPNLDFGNKFRGRVSASSTAAKAELRGIFIAQGFTLRRDSTTPSVAQLAKKVDLETTYKFLYHATSRAVHFSVPELLRRVWGRPGSMRVSSDTFEGYWSAFALYWGGWLYSLTFIESLLILQEPDFAAEKALKVQAAALKIKSHGAIPLLTKEEVYWPESWMPFDEDDINGSGAQHRE